MKLNKIIKDDDIYPRVQISHKTIASYVEALKAGAEFPPITVQGIKSDGKIKVICLDGWHRLEAYREYNKLDGVEPIEEVEVTHWKDEILDKNEWLERLRIVSAQRNLMHGDRLSEKDLGSQGLKIVNDRSIDKLVGIGAELANEWGKTEGYMSQLIGAEVNRRKQSRNALAYSLHLLGWTEREIAQATGVKNAHDLLENFNSKLFQQEYQSGLAPETIATNHNLTQALVWAILLEGKNDLERFKLFGNKDYGTNEEGDPQPRLSDYWVFNKGDPRLGKTDYEGRLFGQQVINILYHYSRQGDLVVDPMAGGGVTVDACLVMNRKCRAYDIDPSKSERKDIEQHDAREEFPPRAKGCDLIILDPPYYKKKEREYEYPEFTENRDRFIENIGIVAFNCFNALKKGGCLAFIYGQYIDYENEHNSVLGSHLYPLFEEVGFKAILKIQTPLSFDTQWHGEPINKAKSYQPWQILPVSRDWYIFKKEPA